MDLHFLQHIVGACTDHNMHFNLVDTLFILNGYYASSQYLWMVLSTKIKEFFSW